MKAPPSFLVAFMRRWLPRGVKGESILGDLREEYDRRDPTVIRDAWYLKHAVLLAFEYVIAGGVARLWRTARKNVRRTRRESFVLYDLRYALRVFRKTPSVTALAVTTLALGIGATTAIFSVVDAALFRPLPYDRPSELVMVWNTYPSWRGHEVLDPYWDRIALSYPEYEDWRDGQQTFQSVAIYGLDRAAVTQLGDPFQANIGLASSTLFPLLGVQLVLGRAFLPHEEGASAHRVAIIAHELWQTRFGRNPDVLGRTIVLDDQPFSIVGVLPSRFRLRNVDPFGADVRKDIWIPVGANGAELNRGNHTYEAIGRLTQGVTTEQASVDIGPLLRGRRDTEAQDVRVLPRKHEEVGDARGQLILLFVAVGILMLIACANVATLLLASAANRRHEFATRSALGAGKLRLARQLLTESVVLGVGGAACGILIAIIGSRLLLNLAPDGLPLSDNVAIDLRVLGFATALGIFTGLLFGVAPALFTIKSQNRLTAHRRTVAGDAPGWFSQRVVVALQLALSLVLVTSAGLLSRSLRQMLSVDPGFSTEQTSIARLALSGDRYGSADAVVNFVREVTAKLRALPGVADVTVASAVPFSGAGGSSSFQIVGREVPREAKMPEAHRRAVLHNFHELLNIPVLVGRSFVRGDVEGNTSTVLVSAALANRYWPGESPLGARIERDGRQWEIVGVVGDVLHADLTGREESTFYFPFYQQPSPTFMLVLRSERGLANLAAGIRKTIWSIDASLPVDAPEPLSRMVRESTADARYRTVIVAVFGVCALLLSIVGVFGVTARSVSSRTRELGIRVALGARTMRLVRTVVLPEVGAVAAGVVVGTAVALVVARTMSTFLFRVQSYDPPTFIVSMVVLAVVGAAAAYLPARRAARVDPVDVLRAD